jgi:uncharacterized membrane protein YfcA
MVNERRWQSIMKGLLGVLAALFGVPLVIGGLLVFGFSVSIDPTIAGEEQTDFWAGTGFSAASVGALLCFAAWLFLRNTSGKQVRIVLLGAMVGVAIGVFLAGHLESAFHTLGMENLWGQGRWIAFPLTIYTPIVAGAIIGSLIAWRREH